MYSIQPDWALSSDVYKKRIVNRMGIAHFYEFRINNLGFALLPSIPDDCIDVVFDISFDGAQAMAAGTVFERSETWMVEGHTYFGMRFLPGVKPVFLEGIFSEYNYEQFDLSICTKDSFLIEKMCELPDFNSRCDFFMEYYEKKLSASELVLSGTDQIVRSVLSDISDHRGIIRIDSIADSTGYTSRYLEKVFKGMMGISPKKYADILRFQSAIDFIDKNPSTNISDVASDFGYYDQPAFVRIFKKCTGLTPREYREIIRSQDYMSRIVNM